MTTRQGHGWRVWLVFAPAIVLLLIGLASFVRRMDAAQPDLGVTWVEHAGGPLAIEVRPEGPAAQAGLREGDQLVAVDGRPIRGVLDASELGWGTDDGGTIDLAIRRGGSPLDLVVVPRWSPRPEPYVYLAIVGLAFLLSGVFVAWRWPLSRGGLLYPALALAFFAHLTLSHTGRGDAFDWTVYWLDVIAGTLLPALLIHLGVRVGRRAGPAAGACVGLGYGSAALLLLWSAWLSPAVLGGAYRMGNALSAIETRDRIEPLLLSLALALSVGLLARGYRETSSGMRRGQMRWMIWGLVAGLGPFALLYGLPWSLGAPELPSWAQLLAVAPMLFVPAAFTAALARYRLQDLDVIVLRGFAEVAAVFCAFAVYAGTVFLLRHGLDQLIPLSHSAARYAGLLVMALLYPQLRGWVRIGVDKAFYRRRYSYRATLLEWARELNTETDLPSLLHHLRVRVRETLGVPRAEVLLRTADGAFETHEGAAPARIRLDDDDLQRLERGSSLALERGPDGLEWARHLFPMRVKDRVRALLALAERESSEEPLNSEDRALLATLAAHASTAIEAARLVLEVRRRAEEISRLHARQAKILESSAVGLLLLDEQGRIQAWNRAIEEIYGLPRGDALGRSLADVFPLHVARRIERERVDSAAGGEARIFRLSLVNRRGERVIANLSISTVDRDERRATAHVLTIDDVSKRVELEEQLLRQERLASLGLLAAGVAHEINTPLTGISSYTQMLLEDVGDARWRETLEKIEAQTRRAARSTNSLLNLARPERTSFEPVDVNEMIHEVMQLFEPQTRGRGIVVEADLDRTLPRVPGHKGKLQQVLLNLLINARDALDGGGTISVATRFGEDGVLLIDVSDDGSGIGEDDLQRIFDPFFTTKGRGKGTGLGLSIAYGIVHEHRGEITVESEPGRFTRFRIRLPGAHSARAMA